MIYTKWVKVKIIPSQYRPRHLPKRRRPRHQPLDLAHLEWIGYQQQTVLPLVLWHVARSAHLDALVLGGAVLLTISQV